MSLRGTKKVGHFEFAPGGRRAAASAASSTSTASEPAGGAGVGAKRSRKQQLQTVPEAAAESEQAGPSKRLRKAEDGAAASHFAGADYSGVTDGVSDKRLTDAARLRKLVSNALRIAVAHAEQTETDSAVLGAVRNTVEHFITGGALESSIGLAFEKHGTASTRGAPGDRKRAGLATPGPAARSAASSGPSAAAGGLQPHPKNIEHRAKLARLEAAVARLRTEERQWRACQQKYGHLASASAVAGAAAGASDTDEEEEDEELMSKFAGHSGVHSLLTEGVNGVFTTVDAMSRALQSTGAIIDAAPAAVAKASVAIRQASFPELGAESTKDLLRGVGALDGGSGAGGGLAGPSRTPGKGKSAAAAAKQAATAAKQQAQAAPTGRRPTRGAAAAGVGGASSASSAAAGLDASGGNLSDASMSHDAAATGARGRVMRGRPSVPTETPAIIKRIKEGKK